MSAANSKDDQITEPTWTVFGHYRDEEFADGGILEGEFAGVFYADSPEEAESLAFECQPWLDADSILIVRGPVDGVARPIPGSQLHRLTNAPVSVG